MVSQLVRFSLCSVLLFLLLPASAGQAAEIDARLDRNPVAQNESFTLTFSAGAAPDGNPDFAPLEDNFTILNQNRSSRISIVNGTYEKSTEWALTLMAKRAGRLTIPPIDFGRDRSRGLTIDVVSAPAATGSGSDPLRLETELDKSAATVREQLILTVRLLRSVNLSAATLTEPEVSGIDCLAHKLGDDRDYEKRLDGVRYLVTERRYALFPQQSGTLTIAPLLFEGRIPERNSNVFDPFGQTGRIVRRQSRQLEIEIAPAPPTAAAWLPARSVELSEEWSADPLQLTVGEPVTRTVTLRAVGQLSSQLPELPAAEIDHLKRYPDQPTLNDRAGAEGVIALRTKKTALVPARPGRLRLPPLEVAWWDTATQQFRTARLPGRDLHATAAPGTATVASDAEGMGAATAAPPPETTAPSAAVDRFYPWPWWSLVAALLACGWLGTALYLRRPRGDNGTGTPHARGAIPAPRFSHLLSACRDNAPQRARDSLLVWGRQRFALPGHASLGQIAAAAPAPLAEEIRRLQAHLYGRRDQSWDGSGLLRALKEISSATDNAAKRPAAALPPLYPPDPSRD